MDKANKENERSRMQKKLRKIGLLISQLRYHRTFSSKLSKLFRQIKLRIDQKPTINPLIVHSVLDYVIAIQRQCLQLSESKEQPKKVRMFALDWWQLHLLLYTNTRLKIRKRYTKQLLNLEKQCSMLRD